MGEVHAAGAAGESPSEGPTPDAGGGVVLPHPGARPGGSGASAWEQAAALRARAEAARATAAELDRQAGAWEAGARGEQAVARVLDGLAPHLRSLHDRLLRPGRSQTNLDHIVIGAPGVFLIDAKNWAGHITLYEGGLWQHKTSQTGQRTSTPLTGQADKVHRMAAEMERLLGTPVEPVLCLAASEGARFTPQRVRGVMAIPVDQLAAWLTAQPPMLRPHDTARLAVAINAAFPPATRATAQAGTATGWGAPPPPVPARSRPTRRSQPRPSRGAGAHRRAPQSRKAKGGGKAVGWLVAALMLPWIGPGLVSNVVKVGASLTQPFTHPVTSPGVTPAARPCTGLTQAAITRILGRAVYPEASSSDHDHCRWYFHPPGATFAPPDVMVTTGYSAHIQTRATDHATMTAALGQAVIAVPQFRSVPGAGVTGQAVTQPMVITYRYPVPAVAATASPVEATWVRNGAASHASRLVMELADDFAQHLPHGPGATDVTLHLTD